MNMNQEPSVVVRPLTRLDPQLEAAVKSIKETIAADGFYGVNEFKQMLQLTGFAAEDFLIHLEEEGITHVRTGAANREMVQEVLVDVRQVAAAMLLIYSEKNFAQSNSILRFLKTLFGMAEWDSAYSLIVLEPLLQDIYEQHGHNFTYMAVADNADLSREEPDVVLGRAQRYINPVRELVKSDAELTAVYQLCTQVMNVVNGMKINGRPATRKDVTFRRFKKPMAYNGFWTAAQKILDMHEKAAKKAYRRVN